MDERTYTTVDKSSWGDGPWQAEPDKVQFRDEGTGLPCLARRHPRYGHWCGYVGVEPGHPLHGVAHTDDRVSALEAHCGVNYSDGCADGDEATSICHIPEPGEPDHVWWFGFDCHHLDDYAPGYMARLRDSDDDLYQLELDTPWLREYRDLGYVRAETAQLAAQLAARR